MVFAVVAGLFAMHGLGMHGVHSMEASSAEHSGSSTSAQQMVAMDRGPDGDDATSVVVTDAGDRTGAVSNEHGIKLAPTPEQSPSPGAGLLGMCLALLALGLLWRLTLAGRRLAWTIPRGALLDRVVALMVTARGPGPPLRAQLSIWRC